MDFHSFSDQSYFQLCELLYRFADIAKNQTAKCRKSYFRIIMHRQTLDSIKSLAISLHKKYMKKSKNRLKDLEFKITLRMIYSFSKTVNVDNQLELFEILISLLLKLIKLDSFYFHETVVTTIQYIEKFLGS